MATPSWLDAAASYATCATLNTTGAALVGTGVATLWAGGGGLVPLSLGMLSFLAAGAACNNIDVGDNVPPQGVTGCIAMEPGGWGNLQGRFGPTDEWAPFPNPQDSPLASEILEVNVFFSAQAGKWIKYVKWKLSTGQIADTTQVQFVNEADALRYELRIDPVVGSCGVSPGDPGLLPPGFKDPVQYIDSSTNCTYNISPQGFVQESEGGGAGMVFKIEAAGPQTLAGGGIVGGCNFEPTLVYQPPGGGPPTTGPWDPTWPDWDGNGQPPWLDFLKGALGAAAAAAINAALDEIFKTPLPAGSKTIYAACEYQQNGDPEEFTVNFPEENFNNRVLTALNAITDFQQQILLWKTPTCSCAPKPQTGDPVSINWVSDEYSPFGNNRLRKLLTYFDQVGTSLVDTVAHWKDFTWEAGSVIVSVNEVPLGKPQVWAASADEGKRVINHAAAIAGVDMTNAEWVITSPRASRYGQTGTMRVHRGANGALGITKRDGPNGLPPALT